MRPLLKKPIAAPRANFTPGVWTAATAALTRDQRCTSGAPRTMTTRARFWRLSAAAALLCCLLPAAAGHGAGRALHKAQQGFKCPTGVDLTDTDLDVKQGDFYTTVVTRFGPDSRQALAFVPPAELPAAVERAAQQPQRPQGGEPSSAAPLDAAEIERLTDWAEALAAQSKAGGARRRLSAAPNGTTRISTYWHVITDTSNKGALTDAQISNQMKILSAAFAPWGFEFDLVDVSRTANNAWFPLAYSSEFDMKSATRRGGAGALNVWSVQFDDDKLLGFATFPSEYRSSPKLDGVVVNFESVPGVKDSKYSLGATLIHEVGHWKGLYHTFQGKCKKDVAKGDMVADTPAERKPNYEGCNVLRDTCKGTKGGRAGYDPVKNWLDYSEDACMDSFTPGQATRMVQQWLAYRLGK
ncbi:hypothetical protein Rsub_04307 [Raphidocelis subcapitata]|uniref:Peptidase M43 pregnancy-associated plasma-A domain-containing protein n=1 Tax=Raphidocelis subcapitata TaxID=307507 RepID=A0A2V0P2Z3_9CHLO|nr:hypothetical protein Rsub_04307 [Raphidocelis subcapitata]|eukprot:GBF91567.1 hypothetical protein Rsub_04307 [Raphidocelis subcapitata]